MTRLATPPSTAIASIIRPFTTGGSSKRRMASYTTHTVNNSNSWPLTNAASG
jgi:hypothetical protein